MFIFIAKSRRLQEKHSPNTYARSTSQMSTGRASHRRLQIEHVPVFVDSQTTSHPKCVKKERVSSDQIKGCIVFRQNTCMVTGIAKAKSTEGAHPRY